MVLMMAALLAKYPVALEGEHRETMVFLYGTEFDQGRAHVRPPAAAATGGGAPPAAGDENVGGGVDPLDPGRILPDDHF